MRRSFALLTLCFATQIFAATPTASSTASAPTTSAPAPASVVAPTPALSSNPAVHEFIQQMVKTYNFDMKELEKIFDQVRLQPPVLTSLQTPREALNWHDYSTLFITPQRVEDGVAFWKAHQAALEQASKDYGVPPEIIVGVLGVETKYGRQQGDYRVIDTLSTIAFQYPQRAEYFKKELAQFLLLCRENKFDPLTVRGSYAGAFGMSQFMPSSYRRYAIDADKHGRSDLINEPEDAIASIANYLKSNGWQANQPVAVLVNVYDEAYKAVLYPDVHHNTPRPTTTVRDLRHAGVLVRQDIPDVSKAMLLQLATGPEQYEYWVGLNNLSVIMRYNPSVNYAMAVFTLGDLVKGELAANKK